MAERRGSLGEEKGLGSMGGASESPRRLGLGTGTEGAGKRRGSRNLTPESGERNGRRVGVSRSKLGERKIECGCLNKGSGCGWCT